MADSANTTTTSGIHRRGFMKAFAAVGIAAPAVAAVEAREPVTEVLADKFTGTGWYTHQESSGTMSVHHIERVWSDMDHEWVYVTKAWPAKHSYADNVFSDQEVSEFIHGPAEWAQDAADLVWANAYRVRRHA